MYYYLKIRYKDGHQEKIKLEREEFNRILTLSDEGSKLGGIGNIDGEIININYNNIANLRLVIDATEIIRNRFK